MANEGEKIKIGSWMDSGEFAAMTMGELVSLMIDGGNTDTCFVRVVKQTPPDENGMFQLHLDVHLVPNGQVMQHAAEIGCEKFHGRLIKAVEGGLVK